MKYPFACGYSVVPASLFKRPQLHFSSFPLSDSYVDYSLRTIELEDVELGEAMIVISRIEIKGRIKDTGMKEMVTRGDAVVVVTHKNLKMRIP